VAAVDKFGRGDDVIYGEAGNDWIHGGRHDDRIDGGIGDDILNGGAGTDVLTGGEGSDIFEFRSEYGNDVITDFSAEDYLAITPGIDGLTDTSAAGLATRMTAFNGDTFLDLGEDTSILFVGVDPTTLEGILETNLLYLEVA
jgi:Ca2+-binding RTX toxin-like protein